MCFIGIITYILGLLNWVFLLHEQLVYNYNQIDTKPTAPVNCKCHICLLKEGEAKSEITCGTGTERAKLFYAFTKRFTLVPPASLRGMNGTFYWQFAAFRSPIRLLPCLAAAEPLFPFWELWSTARSLILWTGRFPWPFVWQYRGGFRSWCREETEIMPPPPRPAWPCEQALNPQYLLLKYTPWKRPWKKISGQK